MWHNIQSHKQYPKMWCYEETGIIKSQGLCGYQDTCKTDFMNSSEEIIRSLNENNILQEISSALKNPHESTRARDESRNCDLFIVLPSTLSVNTTVDNSTFNRGISRCTRWLVIQNADVTKMFNESTLQMTAEIR